MAGSLLIAAIIAVICFAIQPNMNDTINKTTGNVFKQQRNPSWVHSGPKVDKLKDGWFAGDSERDVTEAATETIDGSYLQELEDKHGSFLFTFRSSTLVFPIFFHLIQSLFSWHFFF